MLNVSTAGAISDFGNLSAATWLLGACSSRTRVVTCGSHPASNTMESFEVASQGNEADFGDSTINRRSMARFSSTTRGIFSGGNTPSPETNVIDYVTIATAGNAADFGDLTAARNYPAGGNSSTRGITAGGSDTNIIDYVTIASTGDAADFGDISGNRVGVRGASSGTRCIVFGGWKGDDPAVRYDIMEYVTIASTGNTTDFGNLDTETSAGGICQNSTRACYMGGEIASAPYNRNVVQYVTIASTGNATDWGDIANNMQYQGSASDNHGGLTG
jgi:hypothetical protein